MAEKKGRQCFNLKLDYYDDINELPDEAAGQLFKAILAHANGFPAPPLSGEARGMFKMIARQLDYDSEAYRRKCETNSENIRKRWDNDRPKTDTTVYDGKIRNTKNTKEKEKEKVKDNNMTPCSPPPGDGFEEFWKIYPKKTGKQAALKSWSKLKPDKELTQRIIKAVEYQKTWEQWNRDGGQYIPNPSTWLNQGRWDDEPVAVHESAKAAGKGRRPKNFDEREYTDEEWKQLEAKLFGLDG